MKLKHLKSVLQNLDSFESPNLVLEQYTTMPDTAANVLDVAHKAWDIADKVIADLGCGCGTLGIGAALLGAGFCVGFDIDQAALKIALSNQDYAECTNIDFIQCDVTELEESKWHKAFDTVIMNPPFGTKGNKGIDMKFLQIAASLARHSIYSLHKISTIAHIERVSKRLGLVMVPNYEMKFEIPTTYKMHKLKEKDIDVCLLSFTFEKQNKK